VNERSRYIIVVLHVIFITIQTPT